MSGGGSAGGAGAAVGARPGSGALRRAILRGGARPVPAGERCDLCAAPLTEPHRHLLDLDRGLTRCVCRACSLLFDRPAAADGHLRLVPCRRLRLPALPTGPLGVPVGLAYFVARPDGTVRAHYPGPAGRTGWDVDVDAWRGVVAACPSLAGLAPDVEALLVHTARGRAEYWLVPIDDCFALVSLVGREWRGLSGRAQVWPAVDGFFAALTERRR